MIPVCAGGWHCSAECAAGRRAERAGRWTAARWHCCAQRRPRGGAPRAPVRNTARHTPHCAARRSHAHAHTHTHTRIHSHITITQMPNITAPEIIILITLPLFVKAKKLQHHQHDLQNEACEAQFINRACSVYYKLY